MLGRRALAAAVATALWVGIAFPTRAAAADNQSPTPQRASVVFGKRLYAGAPGDRQGVGGASPLR